MLLRKGFLPFSLLTDELTSLNAQLRQLNLEKRRALNDFLDLKGDCFDRKLFWFFVFLFRNASLVNGLATDER